MKKRKRKKQVNKEPSSRLRTKILKIIALLVIATFFAALAFVIEQYQKRSQWVSPPLEPPSESGIQAAIHFYGQDVQRLSKKYDLPYSYLMALIMLESSGKRNPHPRFEKWVYLKLKAVQQGRLSHYENITRQDLKGLTDKQLRDLAKSWGPFQIMGYKSLKMGISVYDLNNYHALENGIRWINNEYGNLLRQGRYADAFHYHNTGHVIPRNGKIHTTDPTYIEKGLKYMKIFDQLSSTQIQQNR